MANETSVIEYLSANRDAILEAWVEGQRADPRIRAELLSEDELARQSGRLLDALIEAGASVGVRDAGEAEYDSVRRLLAEISVRRERLGMRASEMAASVMSLRDHWILPALAKDGKSGAIQEEARAASRLVDSLALATYDDLMQRSESTIRQQADEMLEISTPVIKVWEGVVAAPLIGALDSERTQRFMERLLETIAKTNSPVALVDITGVPTIDTQTAQHLIDTVSAVRLLGSRVILTGVRPSIAQTLVHLGISMDDILTRSSFAGGLRVAMEMLKLEVTDVEKGR